MAGPPQNDPLIGQILSERYRVLERIGRGGFGAVYKVQHIRLDKALALKVLFDRSGENPRMIKRFEREARAACRIGHENIVEITDFARFGDHGYYFVMEHLEGETLGRRIKRLGPLAPERIVHVGAQIADALAATHGKGIIHRDLKPDNVFLTRRKSDPDFVKVLDFGIAAMMEPGEHAGGLTDHGAMLGTPAYMSPEQATGLSATAQSDIYSLGILLYEMATGSVPFRDQNAMSVLEMHRARDPLPPRQARPDLPIPESLEAIIMRALRKSPTQRYPTMREVFNDLLTSLPENSDTILTHVEAAEAPRRDLDSEREPIEWLEAEEALVLLDQTGPLENGKLGASKAESPKTAQLVPEAATLALPQRPQSPAQPIRSAAGSDRTGMTGAGPLDTDFSARTTTADEPTFVRPSAPAVTPPSRPTEPSVAVAIPIPEAQPAPVPASAPPATASARAAGTYRITPRRPLGHRPWLLASAGFAGTLALYSGLTSVVDRFATATPVSAASSSAPLSQSSLSSSGDPASASSPTPANGPAEGRGASNAAPQPSSAPASASASGAPVSAASAPTIAVPTLQQDEPPTTQLRRAVDAGSVPTTIAAEVEEVEATAPRRDVALATESVHITIESEPPGATVKQGDVVLGVAPQTATLRRDAATQRFTVELTGYVVVTRDVVLDDDRSITVKLRKKGSGGGSGGSTGGGGYDKW